MLASDLVSIPARIFFKIVPLRQSPESLGAALSFRGNSLAMQGVAPMTTSMILGTPVEDAVGELLFAVESDADLVVPNSMEVGRYLTEHTGLSAVLPQICQRVREVFGPDAELSLELYRDPEIDDRYLTLEVRQDQYESDIMDKLDALSEEFANELAQCSGHFLVTTDFSPPRLHAAV